MLSKKVISLDSASVTPYVVRQSALNRFDHEIYDPKGTVNKRADYNLPLLFSRHFYQDLQSADFKFEPNLSTFFYNICRGEIGYDLLHPRLDLLSGHLKTVDHLLRQVKKDLQESKLSEDKRQVLSRFKIRLLVAKAFLTGDWSPVENHFTSFNDAPTHPEMIWYDCVWRLEKFRHPECTRISMEQAQAWISRINRSDQHASPGLRMAFAELISNKMMSFPNFSFLYDHLSSQLTPIEIEATHAKIAARVVFSRVQNKELLRQDEDIFDIEPDADPSFRLRVDFSDEGLCLKGQPPLYFELSCFGEGASLRSFLAQFKLMQFHLRLSDSPDLSQDKNIAFRKAFFTQMENERLINSTGALVFPVDEDRIKQIFLSNFRDYIPYAPDTHADFLMPQIETAKRIYEGKLSYLSGFVPYKAIGLFIHILKQSTHGIADPSLHRAMIRQLKVCLQLCLQAIDISYLDPSEQDQAWDDLAQTVLDYINAGNDVLLPSGSPLSDTSEQSDHAMYISIRHVGDGSVVDSVVMNGGDEGPDFHTDAKMFEGEFPNHYYKHTGPVQKASSQGALRRYIKAVLSLPYRQGSYSEIYHDLELPLKDHPKMFPLQILGSCAVHNLKYALKGAFGFNEKEMGDMMRSGIIGLDELSSNKDKQHAHQEAKLNKNYLLVQEKGRKLSLKTAQTKSKSISNYDAALKVKEFRDMIESLYNDHDKERVDKLARQLFSMKGSDYKDLDHFKIELLYDLKMKSIEGQDLTLQEQYMTLMGWKRAAKEPRPDIKDGNPKSLKIYRTLRIEHWKALANGDYSVLAKRHMGDFKQALRYFLSLASSKVMVEFELNPGVEKKLFSSKLALPKESERSDKIKLLAKAIGADDYPVCNTNEGTYSSAIGVKSEDAGECGFSIGIGSGDVPKIFQRLVGRVRLKSIDGRYVNVMPEGVNSIEELEANLLLGVNNCLINAIARGALNREATLSELIQIRTALGNFGDMLIASPDTIAIIQSKLGINNFITITYSDGSPDEYFEGDGVPLTIRHNNRDHFELE